MKFLIKLLFCLAMPLAQSQTFDSATNTLTLPAVVVDGFAFKDVVVIIDQMRVVSATPVSGSSSSSSRVCEGVIDGLKFSGTIKSSEKRIEVSLTSVVDIALFAPHYVSFVQGGFSLQGYGRWIQDGALWTGFQGQYLVV